MYGPNLPNVGIVENILELTISAQFSSYIAYSIIFEGTETEFNCC